MDDLIGKKIGSLCVLERAGSDRSNHALYLCLCDCGNKKTFRGTQLRGKIESCGCKRVEKNAQRLTKHRMYGTRLYRIWCGIKKRTILKDYRDVTKRNYWGRGVNICDEWVDFENFMNWALSNGYNDSLTIDRIDNDKGYFPNNCRWVTIRQQANNRRNNVIIEIGNERDTLANWCRRKNKDYTYIYNKMYRTKIRDERLFE